MTLLAAICESIFYIRQSLEARCRIAREVHHTFRGHAWKVLVSGLEFQVRAMHTAPGQSGALKGPRQ
jgi:hypothetical protein